MEEYGYEIIVTKKVEEDEIYSSIAKNMFYTTMDIALEKAIKTSLRKYNDKDNKITINIYRFRGFGGKKVLSTDF